MPDAVLRSRVLALQRQLGLVAGTKHWLDSMELQSGEVAEQLEDELDVTIGHLARKQIDALSDIVTKLDTAADANDETEVGFAEQWREYQRVHDASDEVFSECLEFFGGLAIRKNGWDDRICQVADELIRTCARESTGDPWISCTVPAPHEALAKTLARMVRLRFPDWSVWTLPFTAHEYGHVALVEARELAKFVAFEVENSVQLTLPELVRQRASALARERGAADSSRIYADLESLAREKLRICMGEPPETLDEALAPNGSPPDVDGAPAPETVWSLTLRVRESVRKQRIRMHVLIADAFATYTMGPAYCCAALMLRFTPARRDEDVWDTERAAVVLEMLRRMDGGYDQVADPLQTQWDQAVERARAPAMLDPPAVEAVERLVDAAWHVFRKELRPSALYPEAGEREGWPAAQALTARWRKDLKDRRRPRTENPPVYKLRDVINAAWLCRLKVYDDVMKTNDDAAKRFEDATERIEEAAVTVCKNIIGHRGQTSTDKSSQKAHE